MSEAREALDCQKNLYKYGFDAQFYKIRQALMVVSSICLGISFLSPTTTAEGKSFEVNALIIKGVLDNPLYLYAFLIFTSLYYLFWFCLHAESSVIDSYKNIRQGYTQQLARVHAYRKYRAIAIKFSNEHKKPSNFARNSPDFQPSQGNLDTYQAKGIITNNTPVDQYKELMVILGQHEGFRVKTIERGYEVEYEHKITADDYIYLKQHLNLHWIGRRKDWFVTLLPIVYCVFSCTLLLNKSIEFWSA